MNLEHGEIFDDLKAAVHRWNATVTAVIPDLRQDLDLIRDNLEHVSRTLELRYGITLPLLLARAQLDAVQQDENARQQGAQRMSAEVDALNEALSTFEIETHTLAAQTRRAQQASGTLAQALYALTGAQTSSAPSAEVRRNEMASHFQRQIEELKSALADERRRTESAAQQGLPSEVQDELYRLRAEVEALRGEQVPFDSGESNLTEEQQRRLRAVALQEDGKRRRMGQILVQAGIITEQQLEIALSEQRSSWSRHLGAILVQLGFTTEEIIAQTLAAQLRLPFVNMRYEDINSDILDLITINIARLHTCIPLRMSGNELIVVMANPLDIVALDDLRLASGHEIKVCVGAATEIKASIDRYYSRLARA
jgi:chromosome segregation ATPase